MGVLIYLYFFISNVPCLTDFLTDDMMSIYFHLVFNDFALQCQWNKTLSSNLKELEADQLIVRKEYPQIPPKVEYLLSERGKSLMKVLDQLCSWGEENKLAD